MAGGLLSVLGTACCGASPSTEDPGWVQVRSPHFVVASNASEIDARRIADQFEQLRGTFHGAFAKLRVDPPQPIVIVAVRDESMMKLLAPDEWEGPNHVHPAGLFHSDGEKDYVILRLDAEGTTAFHTIYHEYTHALLHLNFKKLPIWLSEGLAEFFGNATQRDRDVTTGTVDKGHLYVLNKNEWLPMTTLLGAQETSPYYNEKNPATIFYAQSWAVTHYLLLDAQARREQLLNKFLVAWDQSNDQVAAGREAFGDLEKFGDTIKTYVRSRDWRVGVALPAPQSATASYAVRKLSDGEVLALRGDLLVHRRLLDQAEPIVRQAVELEPKLAAAHTALGFFLFRDSAFEEADEEMQQAIELGSQDFMAFYCHGVLLLRELQGNEDATKRAVKTLEEAARLNPEYAPTFEALTQAYSRSADTQKKALEAAQTAVKLDPESRTYGFGLAYVLLNNARVAEAKVVAQRLLANSNSEEDSQAAKRLMATIEDEEEWQKESAEESDSDMDAKKEDGSQTGTMAKAARAPAHPAIAKRQLPTPEWMALDGEITATDCAHSPEITITLKMPKGPMDFHATDFRRVGVSGVSEATAPKIESCREWKGRRLKVWFRWVEGKDYVGEITKIYFF